MVDLKQYNYKIEIQKNFQYKVSGVMKDNWVTVYTVFSEKQYMAGKEWYNCNKINQKIAGVYKIHFIKGLNSQFRVLDEGKTIQLSSIVEIENRKTLLLAFEGVV